MAALVPFVTGALGLWVIPEGWRVWVMEELFACAGVRMTCGGAFHWRLSMRAAESRPDAPILLGLSVIPPLLGWFALCVPIDFAVPLFFCAFAAMYYADIWAVRHGLAPDWYPALRKPISLVAVGSMAVAWGATLVKNY